MEETQGNYFSKHLIINFSLKVLLILSLEFFKKSKKIILSTNKLIILVQLTEYLVYFLCRWKSLIKMLILFYSKMFLVFWIDLLN